MREEDIIAANLKCSGCVNTIKKELLNIDSVNRVEVDMEKDVIGLSYEHADRGFILHRPNPSGYSGIAEKNGLLSQIKS